MNKRSSGTFDGAGAVLRICVGYLPDWVHVVAIEDETTDVSMFWSGNMRAAESYYGQILADGSSAFASTAATGIEIYRGSARVATADVAEYLVRDPNPDKRGANPDATAIANWVMDAGGATGYFDQPALVTGNSPVAEGSRICIGGNPQQSGLWYTITSVASDGDATTNVVLQDTDVASGPIDFLGSAYDYIAIVGGNVAPAGFALGASATVNISGATCMFECGTYDDETSK